MRLSGPSQLPLVQASPPVRMASGDTAAASGRGVLWESIFCKTVMKHTQSQCPVAKTGSWGSHAHEQTLGVDTLLLAAACSILGAWLRCCACMCQSAAPLAGLSRVGLRVCECSSRDLERCASPDSLLAAHCVSGPCVVLSPMH